MEAQTYLWS